MGTVNKILLVCAMSVIAASATAETVWVRNALTNAGTTVTGDYEIAGTGGVQMASLSVGATGRLTLDPVKTPVLVTGGAPTFAPGAKIALSAGYASRACGRVALITWKGTTRATIPDGLFAVASAGGGMPALTQETYTAASKNWTRLVLDIDPSAAKPRLIVQPIGDSITDGSGTVGFGIANYRIPLMQKLASRGYDVTCVGYSSGNNSDAAGIPADEKWCWHSGMSGARLIPSRLPSCRAGFRESIEAVLEAGGAPTADAANVILFLIGANDTGWDMDEMYASWTNTMHRIVRARPTSRILVGSVLPFYNVSWRTQFDGLMRAAIEDLRIFPANQVFYVDLGTDVLRDGADAQYLLRPGNQHPSWMGHEITSTHWADAIEHAISQPPVAAAYEPHTTLGAEANVGPAYRAGFERLYSIDAVAVSTTGAKKLVNNGAMSYAYRKAGLDPSERYGKVAYYVELKHRSTGHVRWVWADMDTWGERTAATFAFPLDRILQRRVTALHVDSNDANVFCVAPGDDTKEGWLQFGNGGYSTNECGLADAPAKEFVYDWNLTLNDTGSVGLMQLYRLTPTEGPKPHFAAQTLFAYGNWEVVSSHEIAVGNLSAYDHDTINGMRTSGAAKLNVGAYEVANVEIWAKPDSAVRFNVAVTPGFDFTNAAVTVSVKSVAIGHEGDKIELKAYDTSSGSCVGTVRSALEGTGDYVFDLPGANRAGQAYGWTVTIVDGASGQPVAGSTPDAGTVALVAGEGVVWFAADAVKGVTNGTWDAPPDVVDGAYQFLNKAKHEFTPGAAPDFRGHLATYSYDATFEDGMGDADLVTNFSISDPQTGITLYGDNSKGYAFKAYTADGWVTLSGLDARPGRYAIRAELDYAARHVRYLVKDAGADGYTALKRGADEWLPLAGSQTAPRSVIVAGDGALARSEGMMPDVDVASYNGATYATLAEALQAAGPGAETPVVLRTNATIDPQSVGCGAFGFDPGDFGFRLLGGEYRARIKDGQLVITRVPGICLMFR